MATMPFSEACERNREPILGALAQYMADRLHVLEIGSGTGQHAVYFSASLPHLTWYPTERLTYISTLSARTQAEGGPNLYPPSVLDVSQPKWPPHTIDAIFTANTLHIMSWKEVIVFFTRSAQSLEPRGLVFIYGPFLYDGSYTSQSNREFDAALKARDPLSGLRDVSDLGTLASSVGLMPIADHEMPAFNRLLVFRRKAA